MSEEGRFFTTLGQDTPTYIPGGADINGVVKEVNATFIREGFDAAPIAVAKNGAGAATGTGGDENLLKLNNSIIEYHILGTQTIVSPVQVANGLDIGMDQTDNDGVELCLGILAGTKGMFTVGTDAAFYAKMQFTIADVSGTDDCAFGFRKAEAYQANIDDYDELAALNVISGNVTIETILNGGGTTSTDTTEDWADAATHELEVRVSAAGVVTYKIDEGTPATVAAFTFDDAEIVVPFFYFLQATTSPGAVVLHSFECGLQ